MGEGEWYYESILKDKLIVKNIQTCKTWRNFVHL